MSGLGSTATHGETLFELAQWLARVQQYSASHPACAQLGERTHQALLRSLALGSPFTVEVQKDAMTVAGLPIMHSAVRGRLAPHLYERGVLALRFFEGTTTADLTTLIEMFTLPVQTTFDRGGLRSIAIEHKIARIEIDEIVQDISADERAAQRARSHLRSVFGDVLRNLLAQREPMALAGQELLDLLDHPEIAVTILEEDPLGIAEALAGLCILVRKEEHRLAIDLFPRLRPVIMALAPASHDRVFLGLPALTGEFREALAWALALLDEAELARVALASFRAHATELDIPLYALAIASPHDGRRMGTLRRMSLLFYDLPSDDASAAELITVCALDDGEVGSYRRERECLSEHALRVLGGRGRFASASGSTSDDGSGADKDERTFGHRRVMKELVRMASRTRRFEQLAAKLPQTAVTLARAGATDSVLGILDALRSVRRAEWRDLAAQTLRAVLTPALAGQILAEADDLSATAEGAALDDLVATVRLLAVLVPELVFEQLELSENRRMRQILVEALVASGSTLLPVVREKLHSASWFVVRSALALLPRLGGTARDLMPVVGHADEKVRLEVVRVLRALPPDMATMDLVAAYLTDPSPEVRQHVAVMLRGEHLGPEAIARLERIALGEEYPEELRRRVVEALGRCPLDEAASALFRLLQPRGLIELASLRDHVAVALRQSTAPLAPQYFAEGLRSTAWRVRKACERAAGASS